MGVVESVTINSVAYPVYGLGNGDPVADADGWFGGRLGVDAWTNASADQKSQALVTARRMGDRRAIWSGTPSGGAAQVTAWPRDNATCNGLPVPNGEPFPDDIVYGQFELALALLEDESQQDAQGTGSNVKRAKAGSAEVEFFQPTLTGPGNLLFPVVVNEYWRCYFDDDLSTGGTFTGTDRCSEFDDDNQYDLHRGYS